MLLKDAEIVYVDDENTNTYLFDDFFSDQFNIKCFNEPKEAIQYTLNSDKVLLIITDQSMPEINGITLVESIKKQKPYINSIMLTANPENDRSLMYKTLKNKLFYDFLQKPIDFYQRKTDLTETFKSAITDTFSEFKKIDFNRCVRAFARNPILLDELNTNLEAIKRFLRNDATYLLDLSFIDVSVPNLPAAILLRFEKQISGEWIAKLVTDGQVKNLATSRKLENIYNILVNDDTIKPDLQFFLK